MVCSWLYGQDDVDVGSKYVILVQSFTKRVVWINPASSIHRVKSKKSIDLDLMFESRGLDTTLSVEDS